MIVLNVSLVDVVEIMTSSEDETKLVKELNERENLQVEAVDVDGSKDGIKRVVKEIVRVITNSEGLLMDD